MFQSYFLPRRSVPHKAAVLGFISAGSPADPDPFRRRQHLPIPAPFRRFGMFVFQVDGDSMTLKGGGGIRAEDFVLVDARDVLTDRGQVYAFRLSDGSMVVKRLALWQGRPAMFSDNAAYPPVHLDRSVRNLGRVYAFSADGRHWTPTKYRSWD